MTSKKRRRQPPVEGQGYSNPERKIAGFDDDQEINERDASSELPDANGDEDDDAELTREDAQQEKPENSEELDPLGIGPARLFNAYKV